MDYLRDVSEQVTAQAMMLVRNGQHSQSAGEAGYAQALKDIGAAIMAKRAPRPTVTEDSTYVDPAMRRSKRENLS